LLKKQFTSQKAWTVIQNSSNAFCQTHPAMTKYVNMNCLIRKAGAVQKATSKAEKVVGGGLKVIHAIPKLLLSWIQAKARLC
jgi:hypothetical protein